MVDQILGIPLMALDELILTRKSLSNSLIFIIVQ
uniref:Uncharacterized protein n=1 Tax=Rhizophora mucronata TaxID=61149 RepID=A0A2P2Q4H2_RHIMU